MHVHMYMYMLCFNISIHTYVSISCVNISVCCACVCERERGRWRGVRGAGSVREIERKFVCITCICVYACGKLHVLYIIIGLYPMVSLRNSSCQSHQWLVQ